MQVIVTRRRGALGVLIGAAVLAVHWPAIVERYPMSDDYPYLHYERGDMVYMWWSMGRPLAGLLMAGLFPADVASLWLPRALALAGTIAVALFVATRARRWMPDAEAAATSLLLCAIPAFQVFVGWATCFTFPLASLLGLLAGALALRPGRLRLTQSCAVAITSCLLYQPAAMLVWFLPALAVLRGRDEWRSRYDRRARVPPGLRFPRESCTA